MRAIILLASLATAPLLQASDSVEAPWQLPAFDTETRHLIQVGDNTEAGSNLIQTEFTYLAPTPSSSTSREAATSSSAANSHSLPLESVTATKTHALSSAAARSSAPDFNPGINALGATVGISFLF